MKKEISFKDTFFKTLGILFIIFELSILIYLINEAIIIKTTSKIKTASCYSTHLLEIAFLEIPILMIVLLIVLIIVRIHNRKINEDYDKSNHKSTFITVLGVLTIFLGYFGGFGYYIINSSQSATVKPIIYLYPTEEKEVSVKLLYDNMLTVSYPKYENKWNVLAQEDGTLLDLSTNRNLYSLYYECDNKYNYKVEKDGFIVKGEDSAKFLEEKLAILGLTSREAEEFIIYWLPILEANKYNYIRFATLEEIEANMPLEITPTPDTVIRVIMTFKGLKKPINVEEQKLTTPVRNGFVAVEWGGAEIK